MSDRVKLLIVIFIALFFFAVGAVISKGLSFGEGGSVGIVDIDGVIYSSESAVGEIKSFAKESNIKALILRINSPGGAVAPSQEIYSAILDFKKGGKPVIASLGTVAASGGYYIAAAADTIVANQGTITGSIGVIFEFPDASALLRKVGVNLEVVKSGKYKDAGALHRKITPDERLLFQGVIDDTWGQFVEAVVVSRGLRRDSVLAIADGRVMTGRQALGLGLVDIIGSYEDAKCIAKERVGLPADAPEKKIEKPFGKWRRMFSNPEEIFRSPGFGLSYLLKL